MHSTESAMPGQSPGAEKEVPEVIKIFVMVQVYRMIHLAQ
jgi:hypothetical protein